MDEKEEYMPQKPMYYNYGITEFLVKDINMFLDLQKYSNIILCAYNINTIGKYPFLQFLLMNNTYEPLCFPKIPIYSDFNNENIVTYSKLFLSGILLSTDFIKFNDDIKFEGFYEFGSDSDVDIYLFFDITKCEINIDETLSTSHARFALIEEIINYGNICNLPISNRTVNFFIKNESAIYLYDEKNEAYDTPMVGYVGKSTENKLKFVTTFGESAKNKSEILGPYFYFTNFRSGIHQGGWSHNYKEEYQNGVRITGNDGKYIKGGIVRFALFTGTTKYVENMPNDPIDDSVIKKQRLEDGSLDHNMEVQTIRISDHDGLWAETYNSIYLGNMELDDGSMLESYNISLPILALRDYNQQIPLSYHFINKSKLGDRYDPQNKSYGII